MDIGNILIQQLFSYWYLVLLVLATFVIKTPWFKGVFGEFKINLLINIFLSKEEYYLLKNLTLPTSGGSTQVDHILVSKYGIFVIETKNMAGWIFGGANQKQWTQTIYKHKSKFQNPIHQNYKHVKTLESLLNVGSNKLFSLVVFIGSSQFKSPMPDNVTGPATFIKYIKSKKEILLTDSEVQGLVEQIQEGKLKAGIKTNIAHVRHVKSIIEEKSKPSVCNRCGSPMVLRKVKKGDKAGNEFLGCSTYPKCRNTQ